MARRTAYDSIEPTRRNVEAPHVATPQKIRPPDDTETLLLECAVEKSDPREETEHQRLSHYSTFPKLATKYESRASRGVMRGCRFRFRVTT